MIYRDDHFRIMLFMYRVIELNRTNGNYGILLIKYEDFLASSTFLIAQALYAIKSFGFYMQNLLSDLRIFFKRFSSSVMIDRTA